MFSLNRETFSISRETWRAGIAEFFATGLFVFVGCGAALSVQTQQLKNSTELSDALSYDFITAVALAFGLAISVLAFAVAPISGGHINPAVTFSFLLQRKMSVVELLVYWVAQLLGAILGASILWGCTASAFLEGPSGQPTFSLGANSVESFLGLGSAFLIETMGTFLLVFTVMLTAVNPKSIAGNLAPIAIGWSVLITHLVLIPFTGCGINPARSAGPAIVDAMAGVDMSTRGWWIYYTAPFVGSAAATGVGMFLSENTEDEEQVQGDTLAAKTKTFEDDVMEEPEEKPTGTIAQDMNDSMDELRA